MRAAVSYFEILSQNLVSCDSLVGIATRLGPNGPGIECRWGRDPLHPSRPALGPTQPPTMPRTMGVRLVPGVNRPGPIFIKFLPNNYFCTFPYTLQLSHNARYS
jgi:hypothetical protein